MRIQGKITTWDAGRGTGFITPSTGAKPVFVEHDAFVDKTQVPEAGQRVSFSLSIDHGRPCAVEVTRMGDNPHADRIGDRRKWPLWKVALFLFVLVAAGYFAYQKYHQPVEKAPVIVAPSGAPPKVSQPGFRCDGRTECAQVTSCEEATYFVKNCPKTNMDADGDGVPCELHWCPQTE